MAATYSPSLSDPLSKVRFEIGDVGKGDGTFPNPAEIDDATITSLLTLNADVVLRAAASAAWSLAAKYASMVDIDVDNQLTRASQRYKQYSDLAKRLDERAAAGVPPNAVAVSGYEAGPMVTGIGDTRGALWDAWGDGGYPKGPYCQ
jgi:hypothetical protein